MDLAQGSFWDVLTRNLLPSGVERTALVLPFIRQAALGLAELSTYRLILRDVKPENMLIIADGPGDYRLVISDMGLVKFRATHAPASCQGAQCGCVMSSAHAAALHQMVPDAGPPAHSCVCGTPTYQAPEQASVLVQ